LNKCKLLVGIFTNLLNKFFYNNQIANNLKKRLFEIKTNKIQKENSEIKVSLENLNKSIENLNKKPNLKQKLKILLKEEVSYKLKVASNEQMRLHSGNIFKFSLGCFIFFLKHKNFVRFEPLRGLSDISTKKNIIGMIDSFPPNHLR